MEAELVTEVERSIGDEDSSSSENSGTYASSRDDALALTVTTSALCLNTTDFRLAREVVDWIHFALRSAPCLGGDPTFLFTILGISLRK